MKGNFVAIALIVIGALAPGVNLERFEFDFARLARTGWPARLIALGVALFFTPATARSRIDPPHPTEPSPRKQPAGRENAPSRSPS